MAITINILNAGNMTLGSGGSTPATRTATRVWYGDDESVYTDYEITGTIQGELGIDPPIPSCTTQIPNITSAKKIEIGSSVTHIGKYPFWDCSQLKTITMVGNAETTISGDAFMGCSNLETITIRSVKNIPDETFYANQSIINITFDSNLTSIDSGFSFCDNITNVTFEGKDRAAVQGMTNYPFGLDNANENGVTIHCTDGDIQVSYAGE